MESTKKAARWAAMALRAGVGVGGRGSSPGVRGEYLYVFVFGSIYKRARWVSGTGGSRVRGEVPRVRPVCFCSHGCRGCDRHHHAADMIVWRCEGFQEGAGPVAGLSAARAAHCEVPAGLGPGLGPGAPWPQRACVVSRGLADSYTVLAGCKRSVPAPTHAPNRRPASVALLLATRRYELDRACALP